MAKNDLRCALFTLVPTPVMTSPSVPEVCAAPCGGVRSALVLGLAVVVASLQAGEPAGVPALLNAVRTGDAATWRALVKVPAEVNVRDAAGNTALHLAALNHDVAAVNALLAAGAEVDARNSAEATPLLYGAGDTGIVRALLARGANPNAASKLKNTPLMTAVSYPESFAAAQLLLAAGAELHAKKTEDVEVVLARAVRGGDRRTIDLLLAKGAATDPKSAALALATAAMSGDKAVVESLLAHGADPNLNPDFSGHALNLALVGEHLDVARLLIEKGADPNLRSPIGHATPPMMFASYNQTGDDSVARALIAHGADVNATNDQGANALTYALRNGKDTPLVDYLRRAGVKSAEPARAKRVPDRTVPPSPEARVALVRERMPATLRLLQRSSDAFLENAFVQKSNCTSCHGQDLPAATYGLARERGFQIDEISFGRQLSAQISRWTERAENARQMSAPLPGSPITLGYGLFGLHGAGYAADEMTDAMVRYVIRTQRRDGAWTDPIRRPPIEDGTFVATGWVSLVVRDYPPTGLARAAAESQASSARWLERQTPARHNEVVFQLLGLRWSGVPRDRLKPFATNLAKAQRPDGGWSQLPGLESDAWATGSALYALHEAGMPTKDEVYQRGVAFLLRTQFDDGSWWVRSRSWAFQPHFNGQFPHGKDQWVSQGGTAWAAMALLLMIDPIMPKPTMPTVSDLIAAYAKSPAAQRRKLEASTPPNAAAATVDFARDVRPIFERSCAGCHAREKPRGAFAIASRESLLKGGQSGEPAIAPGYSDDSPLIHYVSGKVEDLEMPPLDRREKYPALTAAEIDLLRAWVDAGAPWPATESLKPKSASASVEQ
jgi:ankyrin repeat protein/mono/diheme cytochrome c family protein